MNSTSIEKRPRKNSLKSKVNLEFPLSTKYEEPNNSSRNEFMQFHSLKQKEILFQKEEEKKEILISDDSSQDISDHSISETRRWEKRVPKKESLVQDNKNIENKEDSTLISLLHKDKEKNQNLNNSTHLTNNIHRNDFVKEEENKDIVTDNHSNEQITQLNEQIPQLNEQISQSNEQITQLNEQITQSNEQITQLNEIIYQLQNQNNAIQKSFQETNDIKIEKEKLLSHYQEEEKKWKKLEESQKNALELNQTRVKELSNQIDFLNKQIEEKQLLLNQYQGEIQDLQAHWKEKYANLEKNQIEAIQLGQTSQEQLKTQISSFEKQLHIKEQEHKTALDQIQTLQINLQSLKQEKLELQNSNSELKQKLDISEKKVSDLQQENLTLQQQLKEKEQIIFSLQEKLKNLESQQKLLQESKTSLESNLSLLNEKQQFIFSTLAILKASLLQLKKDSSSLKQEFQNYKAICKKSLRELTNQFLEAADNQNKLALSLIEKYKSQIAKNKKLYNEIQELRGNIRVYCRVRPLSDSELQSGEEYATTFPEEDQDTVTITTSSGLKKTFQFTRIFCPESTQEMVFKDTQPLVQSVLDGYNVCIFAYGQTGSGKTYTMSGPKEDPGVNLRALNELFMLSEQRKLEYQTEISVSILEIYNESINDLLVGKGKQQKYDIKQAKDGSMYVPDLTSYPVHNIEDVQKAIELGTKNRATESTNSNEHSSRSHALLIISCLSTNLLTEEKTRGKLTLVDLAGSERVDKSGVTDDRLKETQAINKSLSALGNVIAALQNKQQHVPYRDSKLTYLLQDSLGGNSKSLMFVQVNPSSSSVNETKNSLEFAARVASVELGQATRNTIKNSPKPETVKSPTNLIPLKSNQEGLRKTPPLTLNQSKDLRRTPPPTLSGGSSRKKASLESNTK